MKAFSKFNDINKLENIQDKQREWLKDYEGLMFGVAVEGKNLTEWKNTRYKDSKFETKINLIGRRRDRTIIEFDGDAEEAKQYLEKTYEKLKSMGFGFIRSTHHGKSDYLWLEFSKEVSDGEVEQFLKWIAPEGSEIDVNFASSKRIFPVLFAVHRKHSYHREMPIEYFEGQQIDIDKLGIKGIRVNKKKVITADGFEYETIEKKQYTEQELDEALVELRKCYDEIVFIIRRYIDMPEQYYHLIALWVLGTYVHDEFETFPLLFINAVKGSGKSRLLKIISALSRNGKIVLDLKEAVLFRTAKGNTILIDEFEGVAKKESGTLRTLINAAYKKGATVERMKKTLINGKEEHIVERFDLYTPVVMANIWGAEEVLQDRCITVILEKSNDSSRIKLIEDFDKSTLISALKVRLTQFSVVWCSVVTKKNTIEAWNNYIISKYPSCQNEQITPEYIYTYNTLNYTKLHLDYNEMFNKIDETKIDGRNLELFFPLFFIAEALGEKAFNRTLQLSTNIVSEKKSEEYAESKDISLLDFISKSHEWRGMFKSVHDIAKEFKMVAVEDPEEEKWLNAHWVGRSLKRNKLVLKKRRLTRGVQVMIDIDKAGELLKRFREVIEESAYKNNEELKE
jgi:hypothetical protein